MSDRTDERVTKVQRITRLFDRSWDAADEAADALASLAADAAETQKLREHAEKMEATARWEHHEREVVRSYADHVEAERDAAVADRDRLAEALRDSRQYVAMAAYRSERAGEVLAGLTAALAGREGSEIPPAVEAKCECRNRDGSASLVDIEGCPVHGGRKGSDDA